MRLLLATILATMISFVSPLQAGTADEIRSVIEDQVEAFRTDDGIRAFSHASEGIQARFGDPGTFMNMVKTGYPQVYRPKLMEFQALEESGSLTIQEVYFFGQDGSAVVARYFLERNQDGVWKITGVDLRQAPELGV